MGHIFISYSSKDRPFAFQLVKRLERFFDVWIDREEIQGGLQWEKAIEQALEACSVFLVIVSPDSNESEWVARETIRAEQLGKRCIPALLEGELPLRLLNVHYIDFQGDFEGGLRDLLDTLNQYMKPQDRARDEANFLIGEAVRARLSGDYVTANNLMGQVLALQPGLAVSVEAFWKQVAEELQTDYAAQLQQRIAQGEQIITEATRLLEQSPYGDQAAYEWSVYVNADDATLDRIDYVQYQLHPSFESPQRIVRNRQSQFRLTMIGWGTFTIPVEIHFKDGSVARTSYALEFI
jgi:hypothetical protein